MQNRKINEKNDWKKIFFLCSFLKAHISRHHRLMFLYCKFRCKNFFLIRPILLKETLCKWIIYIKIYTRNYKKKIIKKIIKIVNQMHVMMPNRQRLAHIFTLNYFLFYKYIHAYILKNICIRTYVSIYKI